MLETIPNSRNTLVWETSLKDGISDVWRYDSTIFDNMLLPDTIDRDLTIDAIMEKYGTKPLFRTDPAWLKYFIASWSRKNSYTWSKLQQTTLEEYNPIFNYDRTEETTDTRTGAENMTGSNSERENNTNSGSAATTGNDSKETKNRGGISTDSSGSSTESTTYGKTVENTISADNALGYQPDNKQANAGTDSVKNSNDQNVEESHNDTTNESAAHKETSETSGKTDRSLTGSSEQNRETKESYMHTMHVYGNIGVTTTQQMLESERELVKFNIYDFIADSFANEFCLMIY